MSSHGFLAAIVIMSGGGGRTIVSRSCLPRLRTDHVDRRAHKISFVIHKDMEDTDETSVSHCKLQLCAVAMDASSKGSIARVTSALATYLNRNGPSSDLETTINLNAHIPNLVDEKQKTVHYLAYGSNLSAETFLGKRAIKPISQKNVCVPSLKLNFDLPGIAYTEPCFANSGWRDAHAAPSPYHKDRWRKPLVGVLYELTLADFVHVIQTEGGGASYRDVVVDCYEIEAGAKTVPSDPTGEPIKGHTLFAPAVPNPAPPNPPPIQAQRDRYSRPDPSYAQPSARYLKLINDGAAEHDLPVEYRDYLSQIRPYTMTSQKQRLGQFIFGSIWMPIIFFMFFLSRKLSDKDGKLPPWMARVLGDVFKNSWRSYDQFFQPLFGDGERTQRHEKGDDDLPGDISLPMTEKRQETR